MVRNCVFVQFGPGLDVVNVSLMGDAIPVTLSNLPQNARRQDLQRLVRAHGMPIGVVVQRLPKRGSIATVTYATRAQALKAARVLNGLVLDGVSMSARLEERQLAPDQTPPTMRTTGLKLTCPLPTCSAILTFRNADQARERAAALQGRLFDARRISAFFTDGGNTHSGDP